MQKLENAMECDELIAEATNRYNELLNSERQTVANYWDFGRLLDRLRPKYVGEWMAFLDSQGWSYSRVKRAARIYNMYKRAEDCQDLTLMDALGYNDTSVLPPQWKSDEESQEDNQQPEAEEQPEALPIVGPPTEPGLTVHRDEDGDKDGEQEEQDGHEVAAYQQLAESLSFTDDELKKARDYIALFEDPLRAMAALDYVILNAIAMHPWDATGKTNPKIAFGLLTTNLSPTMNY